MAARISSGFHTTNTGAIATPSQCEALLRARLEACERYYQAFQFVVWAGKDSRTALTSTMFETHGQA